MKLLADSVQDAFGKIPAPSPLANVLAKDPTGAGGLSDLLSRLISMFYVLAIVVLIFMLVWGAFDWITSGGEKEKLESAKKKLINAIIGIIMFAVTFAIIQVLGTFTGFKFFVGQR